MSGNDDLHVDWGTRVTMHFTITLEDGTIADSSFVDEPLVFTYGDGSLARGLELAIHGQRPGDHQRINIPPREGFGFPDPDQIHELPRGEFPEDMEPEPGQIIGFTTGAGEEIPGTVLEVRDDVVRVDFNHPLAGHEITFETEILKVEPAPPEGGDAA